jgi:hypothetical protein
MIFNREPVMTQAVVQGAIILLMAFGLNLSLEQEAAILGFSALVLGWIARSVVSPVRRGA